MVFNDVLRQKYKKLILLIFILTILLYVPPKPNHFLKTKDGKHPRNSPDLKISSQEINITTPENNTYSKPMSGYYPATYGFENDDSNDTKLIGWTGIEPAGTSIRVIENLASHKNVVELSDLSGSNYCQIENNFADKVSGTVEFWYRKTITTVPSYIVIGDGDTLNSLFIRVHENGWFRYYTTVFNNIQPYSANSWYHIKIDFDCADQWSIWINDIEYGPYDYRGTPTAMDRVQFHTSSSYANFQVYVDAIGLSWDPNYNIGDNLNEGLLLSYENSTNLDWKGYSLDGQTNKTILGNTTIPMPSLGYHTIQVFGNSSLGFYYESEVRHFTVIEDISINILSPADTTYTSPMSGYYPGTYGFESDIVGGNAKDWGDSSSDGSCGSQVIAEKNGHYNVIQIEDSSGSGKARLTNDFINQAYGTVEFWILPEDATNGGVIRLMDIDLVENRVHLGLKNEHWYSYDGVVDTLIPNVPDPQDNVWQHIRFHFESTAGGYHGLSQYTYEVIIDGIRSGSIPFFTDGGSIDRFYLFTGDLATETRWIDAVGYSWDSQYSIGDNLNEGLLLSFTNSSPLEWMGYSLDDQANKTIIGNTIIPMPENGDHTIQLNGRNSAGFYYESNLCLFSIYINQEPPPPIGNQYLVFILIGVFSLLGIMTVLVVYKKVHIPSETVRARKVRTKKDITKKRDIKEEDLFCPYCNSSIAFGQRFCTYCSSKLVEEDLE
ncbi:MAG: zinc ribbon domain-containing protein [Promethearchaeota archaeon]